MLISINSSIVVYVQLGVLLHLRFCCTFAGLPASLHVPLLKVLGRSMDKALEQLLCEAAYLTGDWAAALSNLERTIDR